MNGLLLRSSSRGGKAEIILANKVPPRIGPFAVLPGLKYIGVSNIGTTIFDLDSARAHGVTITNVLAYSTMSVA